MLNRAVTHKKKNYDSFLCREMEGEGGRTASFRVDGNTGEKYTSTFSKIIATSIFYDYKGY